MASSVLGSFTRFAEYTWRFKLTPSGKALVLGGVVLGSFASTSVIIPLFHLFIALFLLGLLALCAGFVYRPRLSVSGAFPKTATTAHDVGATFTVLNKSRLPSFDVSVDFFELPAAVALVKHAAAAREIPAHGTCTFSVTLRVARRGVYELPRLCAFTMFPFGICRAGSAYVDGRTLLVLPDFRTLSAIDVPIGARYQPGGIALTSNVGESAEYIGNREYRYGDPVRRIDFRAWGRIARPVVKEFQEEYLCRVALVLDTYVPPKGNAVSEAMRKAARTLLSKARPQPEAPLEAAVSLTASIADVLARGEHVIDLFAAGPELHVFRAGRHISHLDNVLEILACVDACPSNPFDTLVPAINEELNTISTVICVFLHWDAARTELLRAALENKCGLKVVLIEENTASIHDGIEEWSEFLVRLTPEAILDGGVDSL